MKNTAMFIIAVCGLGLSAPLASAEDDVLKKMRAFKAVMDTLPESTDPQEEEPQVPPAVTPAPVKKPAEVPAARETYPWQEDYSQPQKKDKTEQRPDTSGAAEDRWTPYKGYTPPLNDMTADDAEEDAADITEEAEDALPWESADTDDEDEDRTAPEMAEDESPEPDMAEETTDPSSGDEEAGSEVSAGDEDSPLPDMTEEIAEDVGGESFTEERTVEESAYEWEEDVTEMEIEADTEQTAQEIKAMLESGIRKDVIAETEADGLEESPLDEAAEVIAEDAAAADLELTDEVREMVEMTEKLNITSQKPVAQEESKTPAAAEPVRKGPPGLSMKEAVELNEPEVLKFRQDMSQQLTPEMLDRHAHIDKLKSEIDAEIEEIQADIELITGIKRGNPEARPEE